MRYTQLIKIMITSLLELHQFLMMAKNLVYHYTNYLLPLALNDQVIKNSAISSPFSFLPVAVAT